MAVTRNSLALNASPSRSKSRICQFGLVAIASGRYAERQRSVMAGTDMSSGATQMALPKISCRSKAWPSKLGRDPNALTYAALSYERTFEDVLRALPRYEQAGLNHVILAFFAWTDQFDGVLKLMERFAGEVGLTAR